MGDQAYFRFHQTLRLSTESHTFAFRSPARTSRNVLTHRSTLRVFLWDETDPSIRGVGECAPIDGLSEDSLVRCAQVLEALSIDLSLLEDPHFLDGLPAVRFAIECAWLDLQNGGGMRYFPASLVPGTAIPINGLVWMNDRAPMQEEALKKAASFQCVKLKIGGIAFGDELDILRRLRDEYPPKRMTIRLDANGAFATDDALERLHTLAPFGIHSIEQPIRAGQWDAMASLCRESPIPIALDEELIGIHTREERSKLLDALRPAWIVLKPTLHGGLSGAEEWIRLSAERGIGWWATSALESPLGLEALAQWVARYAPTLPQGLSTGALFSDAPPSRWHVEGGQLVFRGSES